MVVVGFDGGVDYYVIDMAKASDGREPPVEIWRPGISAAGDQLAQVAPDFGGFVLQLTAEGLGVS